ncbi:MAG: histidine kinase [Chloroflexi bacterium]|nr:MAG: histidine kinase [Chloroflexota bacterium]
MKVATIRFATDILRRLGEELNPNPDQGILELVKNTYDADAHRCVIELQNSKSNNGAIRICDDGIGMDENDIVNGWLLLGGSNKSQDRRTRLGRIPAGNKGIGRLAALRLGTSVELITRPADRPDKQYKLKIDWNEFDKVSAVEDVELQVHEMLRPLGVNSGTEITIAGLKTKLSRSSVQSLARALIMLADPFSDDPLGFKPVLVAPAFAEFEQLVEKRYFEEAEYHLLAEVDEKGEAKASVLDWKGAVLFTADHDEITRGKKGRFYQCPPARFDLWAFLLKKEAFSTRTSTLAEVRAWLNEFGGVHLYENRLRVMPYGNPGNDWLDMNLRRVRSPEERPGTNTSIGRVSITHTSGTLLQKTDRSGLVENLAFQDLRSFAQDALDWMAKRRLGEAEKRRAEERKQTQEKASQAAKTVEDAIATLSEHERSRVKHSFEEYRKARDTEVEKLRKEVQLYRTLSTVGITTATFAHESSGNPIKVIRFSVRSIESRAREALPFQYEILLAEPIDTVKHAVDSLAVLGSAALRLVDHEKRRFGRVDLHKVIENVLTTFKPFLEGRDVTLQTTLCEGTPFLRGSEAAIESILTNLLNNSLAAFESNGSSERLILIDTEVTDGWFTLRVLDSGPGIVDIAIDDIWIPGETTRPSGTGLGLTIVQDTVKDLGGRVAANATSPLGGAEIIVMLPVLGI